MKKLKVKWFRAVRFVKRAFADGYRTIEPNHPW